MRLETLSAELGISPRTLQRRLYEEGQSFSELIRDVQQEVAERLLLDTSLSVQEVSSRVGFANPASFSRAFHLWTGQSPRDYRRHTVLARKESFDE
jgi:AraC-like DNA-binding protein